MSVRCGLLLREKCFKMFATEKYEVREYFILSNQELHDIYMSLSTVKLMQCRRLG
jgi:hypothetical protein